METIFVNTENSKTNEPHKLVLNFSQRLDFRISSKHVALQIFSICYTLANIRNSIESNKGEIIRPTLNVEFKLPDGSYAVSNIQDYTEYIMKKHEI